MLAAAVRGASHEKTGQPCQDAVAWRVLPGNLLLAAVADGAGSAPLSEIGAELATGAALDFLEERLGKEGLPPVEGDWRGCLKAAAAKAREAVQAEAAKRNTPARDLATTLLLLAATPERAVALQIGDGAALVSAGPESLAAIARPPAGEYLNETTFITSDQGLENAALEERTGKVTRAALFSDGLQMLALKMPTSAPHLPFFAPLFRFLESATDLAEAREQLKVFLNSPRIRSRADDDLTLLLAVFAEPGEAKQPAGEA